MNFATLGLPGTLTSFLLFGLALPVAPEAELDCTSVIAYDFTTASAPFYPVANQPGFWRDPAWAPPTFFSPPTAGFPNLTIARNAEISGGELQYINTANLQFSSAIFGNIDANATDWLDLFNTYGGTRTIHVEGGVDFHADLYAADLVGTGRIFTVYSRDWTGDCVSLIAEDTDGPPSGDIVLKLIWCIDSGIRTTATVATMPRAWADGVHVIRVEMKPSTPQVPGSTINHALNFDGSARVYIDGVLEYEDTSIQFRTVVAYSAQINDAFTVAAVGLGRNSNTFGFVGGYTYLEFGYCDVPEPEEPPVPPGPGGETPETEEPTTSPFPTGITRLFGLLTYGNGSPLSQIAVAETTFSFEPRTWFGGMKSPWLISVEPYTRKFSDNLQGVDVRVVLADPQGVFRALAATTRLSGTIWEHFLVSDTVRYALGEPHRRFCGRVRTHRAIDGWKYELIVRDLLSDDMARLADAPLIPPAKITPDTFPAATEDYQDRAVPIAIGVVSDESEDNPQGVAPPLIVAPSVNLSYFGGVNVEAVPAIISHGAIPSAGLIGYFNTIDNPYTRIQIPESAWGTILTAPGKPGWEFTGLADDWADYPTPLGPTTQRYTPVFFLASDPNVQAFVDGRIQVAFNLIGRTEFGDGTGRYLSDAPDAFAFLVTNYMKPPYYRYGDHNDPPVMFRGYPVINGAGIIRTRNRLRSFLGSSPSEYPIGLLIAGDGRQQTLRHWLKEMCAGVLMEQGPNRHGQCLLDVEDVNAPAEFTLSDIFDIERGTFSVTVDHESYADSADYKFGERYLPAVAPLPTPPEGETLPPVNVGPHAQWQFIGTYQHTDAITQAGDRGASPPLQLENRVVRNSDVALNVVQRVIDRAVGPGPAYQGQWLVEVWTSWQGLDIELGSVVAIDHIEGFGTGGFVGRRFRVLEITDDLQNARIGLKGRILTGDSSPS
jgi:hypothetical protein